MKLTNKDISRIKEFALQAFHCTPSFKELDSKEMQILCILMGLETLMTSQGLVPGFCVELVNKDHDSLPIDEEGLGIRE